MHPQSFKALLRKAAERTVDGLWTAIGTFIDLFKPPGVCQRLRRRTIRSAQAVPDLATAIISAAIFVAASSFRIGLSFGSEIFPLGFHGVFAGGFWRLGRKSLG